MKFTLSTGAKLTNNELFKYFNYSSSAPSASALNQLKAKIKPDAFKYLMDGFTDLLSQENTYKGYRLIACDGTRVDITRGRKVMIHSSEAVQNVVIV